MDLRVIWGGSSVEPLEPARRSCLSRNATRPLLRLYEPLDTVEISSPAEKSPDAPDMRSSLATLAAVPESFQVPLLSRLIAAAQWCAYQVASPKD
jgi:hypothetical protein